MTFTMPPLSSPLIPEDIANPEAFTDPDAVDALFAQLRRDDPVPLVRPEHYRPFWLLTKYQDIMEVEAQPELFLSEPRTVLLPEIQEQRNLETFGTVNGVRTLVQMDNPDHAAYRALTESYFKGQNLMRLQGQVADIARTFIDHMAGLGGSADFASDVAFLYPLRVIMLILGIPQEDEPRMLKLTQELFGGSDEEFQRETDAEDPLAEVITEFITFFTAITADRRANPRDDLSSVIANGRIDGAPIGEFEAMSYYIIAATAGHDTTSATTAGGMLGLLQFPDELTKLKADLSLVPSAIDEFVRWVTPVKHFMRTATQDYEIRGRTIRAGESVMLHYQSANRDEEVFDDPFVLKVDRRPNRHLAFGHGPHICLGRFLALMEMRAFYNELIPRLDHIELAGLPEFSQSYFVSGLKHLPVRYRMR